MKRACIALFMSVSLIVCLSVMWGCRPSKEAGNNGASGLRTVNATVTYVEGDVKIDGIDSKVGDNIGAKATVITGNNSSCEVTFNERNIIAIAENTQAVLDLSQAVKELSITQGTIRSVLKKLDRIAGTDSFKVLSNTSVLGVRGTTFCVHAEKNTCYICACNGVVNVSDLKGANAVTLSNAHHGSRIYSADKGKIAVVSDGLKYHSDKDMEALASKVGYVIDWNNVDKN